MHEMIAMLKQHSIEVLGQFDVAKPQGRDWQGLTQKADALISFAGDGTLKSILNSVTIPVLPLPGGTMNMLPEAVLGQGTWQQHLARALKTPVLKGLEAVEIGNERFYVGALLGTSAHFGKAREAARHGLVRGTFTKLKRAVSLINRKKMSYRPISHCEGYLAARELVLLLPAGRQSSEKIDGFEVAAFGRMSAAKLISLGRASILGDWRDSEAVRISTAQQLHVMANGTVPALLDGEFVRLPRNMTISYLPKAALVWSH